MRPEKNEKMQWKTTIKLNLNLTPMSDTLRPEGVDKFVCGDTNEGGVDKFAICLEMNDIIVQSSYMY